MGEQLSVKKQALLFQANYNEKGFVKCKPFFYGFAQCIGRTKTHYVLITAFPLAYPGADVDVQVSHVQVGALRSLDYEFTTNT